MCERLRHNLVVDGPCERGRGDGGRTRRQNDTLVSSGENADMPPVYSKFTGFRTSKEETHGGYILRADKKKGDSHHTYYHACAWHALPVRVLKLLNLV